MEFHLETRGIIEAVSMAIELLAVVLIVAVIVLGCVRYALDFVRKRDKDAAYNAFKVSLGKGLLLGLEVLVAGDVIRTVALEPTLDNVLALGVLVAIRTFLSWSLVVEIEGRWPWRKKINE